MKNKSFRSGDIVVAKTAYGVSYIATIIRFRRGKVFGRKYLEAIVRNSMGREDARNVKDLVFLRHGNK